MNIIKEGQAVAMCSDHAGYELKCIIEGYLESKNIVYHDFGTSVPKVATMPILLTRVLWPWSRGSAIRE